MFIRKSTRRHQGKTYVTYRLVEAYRTDKGPRQRTLCSLGDLKPRDREQWLALVRHVEQSLSGQQPLWPDPHGADEDATVTRVQTAKASPGHSLPDAVADRWIEVDADRVRTEEHREAGPVHVGYQFWQRLGLDDILAQAGLRSRARRISCAMTLNRLIDPRAELAMPDWIRRTALAELLEVDFTHLDEDALYRNLDRLHPQRATIESALVKKERNLFNLNPTLVLYDLTSTYFEGTAAANPKAKHGYSRDKRSDCKQVVIGLAIGREGFPLAHEVLEGNVHDHETLDTMLDKLHERVGLQPGQTVVVDRGMAYPQNLEQIRKRNLHYLVATRQAERDEWLDDFDDDAGFDDVLRVPSPRNPFQKKSKVRVKLKKRGDELFVLCHSQERVQKDRAIREKKEQRLLVDLEKLSHRVKQGRLKQPTAISQAIGRLKERYPSVARYYAMDFDGNTKRLSFERNEAKWTRAHNLDGTYLLRTNRLDLTADEAWRTYSMLTRAEEAFRDMKSPLAERPIFHHLERRVEAHIFLCVLAYHLLVAIEKTLLDQNVHTSWATVRDTLRSHQVCSIVLPTRQQEDLVIRKGSTPEPEQARLYDLLSVPHQVIAPRKFRRPLAPPVVPKKSATR